MKVRHYVRTYASSVHKVVYPAEEQFRLIHHLLNTIFISHIDMQGVHFVVCKMAGLARLAHLSSLFRGFQIDVCANNCMGSTRRQGEGNFAADAATCQMSDECTVLFCSTHGVKAALAVSAKRQLLRHKQGISSRVGWPYLLLRQWQPHQCPSLRKFLWRCLNLSMEQLYFVLILPALANDLIPSKMVVL